MIKNHSYFFARLPIGMSFLGHGLVRIPKLNDFAAGMQTSYAETLLPGKLVYFWGWVLPWLELFIGISVLLGLFTRTGLQAGLITMTLLIFGSSLVENWNAVSVQLIHGIYLSILLYMITHNSIALDHLIKKSES